MKQTLVLLIMGVLCSLNCSKAQIAPDLTGSELISHLRSNYYIQNDMGYNRGRDSLYGRIDNVNNTLTCVYTGYTINLNVNDGDPSSLAYSQDINCEHSWPQSFYNEATPMRSDLHHLFPTWVSANSTRSNYPFAEIDDNVTAKWMYNKNSYTSIPAAGVIDLYSEYANSRFEPREDHKGDLARAMFYFWTMYQNNSAIVNDATDNEAFFNNMKVMLLQWHHQDPLSQKEIDRNEAIHYFQGNRNPFVSDTTLVMRAYFEDLLPVELTSFTSSVIGDKITLNWITATEENNYGFDVEVNKDGEWAKESFVPGFGTSSLQHWYSYLIENAEVGNYSIRLKQLDFDGTFEYSDIIEASVLAPNGFSLKQNYPNPFNPTTMIEFSTAIDGIVNLTIFNSLGEQVKTLVNKGLQAGNHEYRFDASNLESGIYFYRLQASGNTLVNKMILLK